MRALKCCTITLFCPQSLPSSPHGLMRAASQHYFRFSVPRSSAVQVIEQTTSLSVKDMAPIMGATAAFFKHTRTAAPRTHWSEGSGDAFLFLSKQVPRQYWGSFILHTRSDGQPVPHTNPCVTSMSRPRACVCPAGEECYPFFLCGSFTTNTEQSKSEWASGEHGQPVPGLLTRGHMYIRLAITAMGESPRSSASSD